MKLLTNIAHVIVQYLRDSFSAANEHEKTCSTLFDFNEVHKKTNRF